MSVAVLWGNRLDRLPAAGAPHFKRAKLLTGACYLHGLDNGKSHGKNGK